MEVLITITGYLLIALSLIHIIFPRRFNWKTELVSLNLLNRQMMYVHTFFIGLVVLLMGVLCVTSAGDLLHTTLGRRVSMGLCIFWSLRLVFQFFVYSPLLWKGKKMETFVHIVFALLWAFISTVFFIVGIGA